MSNLESAIHDRIGALSIEQQQAVLDFIENLNSSPVAEPYPLTFLLGLATDMGVSDLAENHAVYAGRRANSEAPANE